jgi:catechol 2,3-dioxygenase-like lactoylglutathione lyase family enzyme
VKPRQLAHVVRRTSRFDELVRWYCTVLGAEVVHGDAANPIGVVFDPAELLARYRAGEALPTLTARPPLPEGSHPFDMVRF